jgi:ATPase family protein associated with various cellular activities (AAA)/winged helix domain-containing protein
MNAQDWQTTNAQYLSAALEWLRLRLLRLAKSESPESSPASTAGAASPSIMARFRGRAPSTVTPSLPALPAPAGYEEEIARLENEMQALENRTPPPSLVMLRQQLGMSQFEGNVLLLCAGLELDTRVAGLCARIQDDPNRPYPTYALALSLFDDPAWEALSPDRPLRYWRLIEINQPGAQPLTSSALRADERIVSYLKGLNTLDDRLAAFISPIDSALTSPDPLPPSQEAVAGQIVQHWQRASGVSALPIIQLLGPDPISKQLIAARAAAALGRHVHRLGAESLPAQVSDLETLARLWQRESILLPLALFLDAQEVDSASSDHGALLQRFLGRADGVIFLSARENWQRLPRANFSFDIAKPLPAEQRAAWQEAVGVDSEVIAGRLAAQFNINVTTITQVAQDVLNETSGSADELAEKLWAACCSITRPRLDALAQRIDPKATWDDIVLPAEQSTLLHQIAHQVGQRHTVYEDWGFAEKMNRGLGISALFAGDSGTGKTMAAEVIANELKLNLYRIDLSAVVSKYIGETEKNLRRLFDAAEDGGAILFFDEADALFGKRSEVKDSHDRYANIEINYLLQRMEAYRGLAILATNMKSALDTAFMRRLRFIVNFPFPGADERKLIWQKVFPQTEAFQKKLDIAQPDYERLARFNITGGNIHSIALNAAFAAAQSDSNVTLPVVLSSARMEFRKLEKPISEAEFR